MIATMILDPSGSGPGGPFDTEARAGRLGALAGRVVVFLKRAATTLRLRLGPNLVGSSEHFAASPSRKRTPDLQDRVAELELERDQYRAAMATTEAANAAKSRFVAFASHELRTPLNGILGMTELLGRTGLSAEQATYVDAISASGEALLAFVDDMLDIGRIEAGRLDLRSGPVDLEAVVEEVVELLAPRAHVKGLEFAAHVASQVPELISADGRHLSRVLMNLAGNAIKFTAQGGVAIDVAAQPETDASVLITFRVRDTGIGIAAVDQDRIFRAYEQAGPDADLRTDGTGLGLSIARTVARAMGGDIRVDSAPGQGAVFSFSAPFPALSGPRRRDFPLAGRRVLVLSAGRVEPPMLMRQLFDLGATVELAGSVAAARAALAQVAPFDVLVLDHARPAPGQQDSTGSGPARTDRDVAAMLAALPPGLPPVVVLVAPIDRGDLPRLLAAGAAAHLVKPVRNASLAKVILAAAANRAAPPASPYAAHADPADPEAVPRRGAGAGHRGKARRVLIADDNEINLLLGRTLVAALGHDVETATDGADAVAKAASRRAAGRPYDAVLMDLHMPVLDGFAAIRAIRESETPGSARSVIFALSADNSAATELLAISAGADACLAKPIESASLAAALSEVGTGDFDPMAQQQRAAD